MSEEKIAEVLASYVTKDSGKREDFSTGARRDTQEDKTHFHLIPTEPLIRLAGIYRRGAEKYGLGNYQKGIPYMRVAASLLRHYYQWREGDEVEDHMAAVAWNAFTLLYYDEMIKKGSLPKELDDRKGSVA